LKEDIMNNSNRSALVTGATSGLGFEAAAQLAEQGYRQVIITGRTLERAEAAVTELAERTGKDVFEILVMDLNTRDSVTSASHELMARSARIDFLLLNAGVASGKEMVKTSDDVEVTFASSLIGHHQLTAQLLDGDVLTDTARIVIAGSEAARDDVPSFSVVDLPALAKKSFGRDLEVAAEALIRGSAPIKYNGTNTYATAKLFTAWWSAALARRLPAGMTVNTVSPGSALNTNGLRNQGFFMRRVMTPLVKKMPARMGLTAPTSVAAGRYLEAADFDEQVTGQFFASAPKKMTGSLHRMVQPHVLDFDSQEAAWNATVHVAGDITAPGALL
jgi:NAD(P)-dependent dehydrogenase (short-subunit alcohol dehydrogenase family)